MDYLPGGADDLSYLIKKVTFRLHETYTNPARGELVGRVVRPRILADVQSSTSHPSRSQRQDGVNSPSPSVSNSFPNQARNP